MQKCLTGKKYTFAGRKENKSNTTEVRIENSEGRKYR
jgi:hypothetical protein